MTDEFGPAEPAQGMLEYVRPLEAVDAPRIAAQARRLCGRLGTSCGILLLIALNLPVSFGLEPGQHWWWEALATPGAGQIGIILCYILLTGLAGTFIGAFLSERSRAVAFIVTSLLGLIIVMFFLLTSMAVTSALSVIGWYASAGVVGIAYVRSKGLAGPRGAGLQKVFGLVLVVCSITVGGYFLLNILQMASHQIFSSMLALRILGPAVGSLLGYATGFAAGVTAIRAARPPLNQRRNQVAAVLAAASVLLPLLAMLMMTVRLWATFGAGFPAQAVLLVVRLCVIAIAVLLFLSLGLCEWLTEPYLRDDAA